MSLKVESIFFKTDLKDRNFLDDFPQIYNVYLIARIAEIAGMMFEFDIYSMFSFIGTDSYISFFYNTSSNIQGFIISSIALGSFSGSITSSFILEPCDRTLSLLGCSFLLMVGVTIQFSSQNRAQLIEESAKSIGYVTLFTKKYIKRKVTTISAQIRQQLTGRDIMS